MVDDVRAHGSADALQSAGPLVLAIDAGTTSIRALVLNAQGAVLARAGAPLPITTPEPGWVEQDGMLMVRLTRQVLADVLGQVPGGGARIAAVGLTNQRETVLLWDRTTGTPIAPAIVWQDRRTAPQCEALRAQGLEPLVQTRTGLLLDPYFSATKLAWLLDRYPGARSLAEQGGLCAGTVDSFLIWHLCGRAHITDATNASRTLLLDLATGAWDGDLCATFDVPMSVLPRVTDSAGMLARLVIPELGLDAPLTGLAGDQQAAAIGQACLEPGMAKLTLGTGAFLLVHAGPRAPVSRHRLLSTIAWQIAGERRYALEGALFVAGSAIQWLRDGLGLIRTAQESEALAASVPDSDGVQFVPAFVGLGAPYWDPDARGLLCGLTRGTSRAHIVRACLEAISQQTCDLGEAFAADGLPLTRVRVDGGMSANNWLLQNMADCLGCPIDRPAELESTALGVAMLASVGAGLVRDLQEAVAGWRAAHSVVPGPEAGDSTARAAWKLAVARSRLNRIEAGS